MSLWMHTILRHRLYAVFAGAALTIYLVPVSPSPPEVDAGRLLNMFLSWLAALTTFLAGWHWWFSTEGDKPFLYWALFLSAAADHHLIYVALQQYIPVPIGHRRRVVVGAVPYQGQGTNPAGLLVAGVIRHGGQGEQGWGDFCNWLRGHKPGPRQ